MNEKFVIIEYYLFEGWLAIEGNENDKLITYDSFEEAEEELKNTLRESTESGLEGYDEDSEVVSDYFVDSKGMKKEHLHYNKILGDNSVNISFTTLKKIIDTYCTDTSEDIFMVMHQILDTEFIKFYQEKEITDLLDYAIFEKYIQINIENNPLLQVLKEKNSKYFDYATNRIEKFSTKLDKIRIEILKKKR